MIKAIRHVLSVLAGVCALCLLFGGCYYLGVAHAQSAPISSTTTAPPLGDMLGFEGKLAAWSVVLYAFGRLVLEVLKVRAPQTPTKWDDLARDALARVLGERAPTQTVVAVVQPPPPPREPPGFAHPLLLVVMAGTLVGVAVGAVVVGCAQTKAYTTAAGEAVIDCGKQDLPAIAALVADFGARAALSGQVDWPAVETAAKGAGLGVGACAVAYFLREIKKQPEAQVAARGGEPDVVAQGTAVLARLSGGAEVRLP